MNASRSGAIGLDMGQTRINLVQMDRINGAAEIRAATSIAYPSGRDDFLESPKSARRMIRAALKAHPFKGRKIVATLPAGHVKLMLVKYQSHSATNNAELIVKAIRERGGVSFEKSVIDYIAINSRVEHQSQQSALVAIADKQKTLDYLNWLEKCRLQTEILEIGPIAINRLVCAMHRDRLDMKVLALNFGSRKSYLTVVWGRRLLLDRVIDYGLEQVLDTLAKALQMEPDAALRLLEQYGFQMEAGQNPRETASNNEISHTLTRILAPFFRKLAAEINEVLLYTASETRGGTIDQIHLFGSLARVRHTDTIIDKLLSIPVSTVNPFYGFSVNRQSVTPDNLAPVSGIAVATGLALRGLLTHA